MVDMKKDFEASISKALSILGKDGDIVAPQIDSDKQFQELEKARSELNKARTATLTKIQDYENALDAIKNNFTSYKKKIAKDEFKLDEKKADDKKKIAGARKIIESSIAEILSTVTKSLKVTGDLDTALEKEIS